MDLPIIVVTRGNVERLHTLRLLNAAGVPFTVVVHDENIAGLVRSHAHEVVVSGTNTLVEKRNWILDELVPRGSWFVGMDDNVKSFTKVADEFYGWDNLFTGDEPPSGCESWRRIYNTTASPKLWLQELKTTVRIADKAGINLVGVSTMENPFFRPRKYSNYRFVKSKIFAMKNTGELRWKHEMCHDSYLSALAVAKYGRVLVNSFLHYESKMYEAGGLGDREARERFGLVEQLMRICEEFPGLVALARGKNSALRFRLTSENGVERWRREHGYV